MDSMCWHRHSVVRYMRMDKIGYDLITTALRTSDGLDMNLLDSAHRDYMLECARKYLQSGQLEIVNGHLRIEENSIFVSDMIMSDLMKIE